MIGLRRAEEADAEVLTRIRVDAFKLENVIVGQPPPGHDRVEVLLQAIRETDVRVVTEYDRPIGCLGFSPDGRFGRDLYLGMLFIVRSRQGRGAGRRVWRSVEAEMAPGTIVSLDAPAASPRVRRFFRSLGFAERVEFKPAFLGDGNLRMIRMTKRVAGKRSRTSVFPDESPPPEPASTAEPASPS